jgi:hypothetical protein
LNWQGNTWKRSGSCSSRLFNQSTKCISLNVKCTFLLVLQCNFFMLTQFLQEHKYPKGSANFQIHNIISKQQLRSGKLEKFSFMARLCQLHQYFFYWIMKRHLILTRQRIWKMLLFLAVNFAIIKM